MRWKSLGTRLCIDVSWQVQTHSQALPTKRGEPGNEAKSQSSGVSTSNSISKVGFGTYRRIEGTRPYPKLCRGPHSLPSCTLSHVG